VPELVTIFSLPDMITMTLDHQATRWLQDFLAQQFQSTCQTPQVGSLPLYLKGKVCGSVTPSALLVIQQAFPLALKTAKVDLDALVLGEDANEVLADLATALFKAGCLPRWRGELLDVWADGQSIGAIERSAVRALGTVTRAVHLNAWSMGGDLWIARRALDKATDPGMWDTLVGGLVGFGESDDLALVRESAEEAGLAESDLASRTGIRLIGRMQRRLPEGYQCEDVLTSECVLAADVVPANQDGEVMEIVCLPPQTIVQMLRDGQFTVEAGIVIAEELLQRLSEPSS
jgi:8-oxo-dGTP pyrophosphatase MutT (NUDIX family)